MRWRKRLSLVLAARRVTETLPARADVPAAPGARGSLFLRHVDAGSCNGCELELASAFGPVYDAERVGARLVAAPRHADGLVVTGPVTKNMARPLADALDALARPRIVVALGDCAIDCGAFAGAYGVAGSVVSLVGASATVPGCPPRPEAILGVLRALADR